MSLSIIISSILFGLILSSLVSFLEMSLSKKQRWLLAIMEITLGTLGAVSAGRGVWSSPFRTICSSNDDWSIGYDGACPLRLQ